MHSKEGEKAILNWVRTLAKPGSIDQLDQLADGAVMASILNRVDADFFSDAHFVKRLTATSVDNVDICELNAAKVTEKVLDYYRDCLQLNIANFAQPEPEQIARGNAAHICQLLQLILGAAVNCDHKNDFIAGLMQLDEIDQAELMAFIQIILDCGQTSQGAGSDVYDEDQLKQRLHELEKELAMAAEENNALRSDLDRTREFIERETKTGGVDELTEQRLQDLQRKYEDAQDELMTIEHAREDERIHAQIVAKELEDWRQRAEQAEQKADEAVMLQDEVDYLREKADQATRLQAAVDSFKKKLDGMKAIKDRVTELEENVEKERLGKEDEQRRVKSYKSQNQTVKQQLAELQMRQTEDQRRLDRLVDDLRLAKERATVAESAQERLQAELLSLKEMNDELSVGTGVDTFQGESLAAEGSEDGNYDLMPPQIREQMIRLGAENKRLKEQNERELMHSNENKDEMNATIQKLIDEKQILQERIAQLEKQATDNSSGGEVSSEQIEELEKRLTKSREDERQLRGELSGIQTELADEKQTSEESVALVKQKEEDIKAMESRYRSYLEKARSVIKTLDPKHNNNTEVVALRAQVAEKDRLIKRLESESREKGKSREQEEKLLVSAWYQLGNRNSRGSVEDRVGRSQPGQSFLARQRQQTQQRRNQSRSVGGGGSAGYHGGQKPKKKTGDR